MTPFRAIFFNLFLDGMVSILILKRVTLVSHGPICPRSDGKPGKSSQRIVDYSGPICMWSSFKKQFGQRSSLQTRIRDAFGTWHLCSAEFEDRSSS
jgi:hypothetical protein